MALTEKERAILNQKWQSKTVKTVYAVYIRLHNDLHSHLMRIVESLESAQAIRDTFMRPGGQGGGGYIKEGRTIQNSDQLEMGRVIEKFGQVSK